MLSKGLIASRRSRDASGPGASGMSVSMAVHAVLIIGALKMTAAPPGEEPDSTVATPIVLWPQRAAAAAPARESAPVSRTRTVSVQPRADLSSVAVPNVNLPVVPDPWDMTGNIDYGLDASVPSFGNGTSLGVVAGGTTDGIFEPAAVDQRPQLLAGMRVRYPEVLRQAGIEGGVDVEFVVDTVGRVEAESIVILRSAHVAMADAVRDALRRAVFRPARLRGRPVRVRVRQAVTFEIR